MITLAGTLIIDSMAFSSIGNTIASLAESIAVQKLKRQLLALACQFGADECACVLERFQIHLLDADPSVSCRQSQ